MRTFGIKGGIHTLFSSLTIEEDKWKERIILMKRNKVSRIQKWYLPWKRNLPLFPECRILAPGISFYRCKGKEFCRMPLKILKIFLKIILAFNSSVNKITINAERGKSERGRGEERLCLALNYRTSTQLRNRGRSKWAKDLSPSPRLSPPLSRQRNLKNPGKV